jgi:DNA polymerase-3 subunit epsilon
MNLAIFYDTETTGLPLFKEPSEHPDQPHIVQLAACVVDLDTQDVINSMNVIIKPDGWTIPDEVSAIHDITTEHALQAGIPETEAIDQFLALWSGRLRIGHNEQFDARIIRIALKRFKNEATANNWKLGSADCTAKLATPICALPPTEKMRAVGRTHFKTPNLAEAYRHFMDSEMENAHNAMADVNACMKVYFAIKQSEAAGVQ